MNRTVLCAFRSSHRKPIIHLSSVKHFGKYFPSKKNNFKIAKPSSCPFLLHFSDKSLKFPIDVPTVSINDINSFDGFLSTFSLTFKLDCLPIHDC